MIKLRSDCLAFETSDGCAIPCSAEQVTLEIIGEAAQSVDPEIIREAASAVLHYFREELGREHVTAEEFTEALERALRAFGLVVKSVNPVKASLRVSESDLRQLACESGKGFELAFFPKLRDELEHKLSQAPQVLRFTGLRGCVKQLVGAQRWSGRCQLLSDQIVEYLRNCISTQPATPKCALLVQ